MPKLNEVFKMNEERSIVDLEPNYIRFTDGDGISDEKYTLEIAKNDTPEKLAIAFEECAKWLRAHKNMNMRAWED